MMPDPQPVKCPTCGDMTWTRQESGTYTERHTLDTGPDYILDHTWDNQETMTEESEDWECSNGHVADDDTTDRLMEW